jgi:hypothetical protein
LLCLTHHSWRRRQRRTYRRRHCASSFAEWPQFTGVLRQATACVVFQNNSEFPGLLLSVGREM